MSAGQSIPLARPWLDTAEADAARDVVLSGWVMQGPKVKEFEVQFAQSVGAPHACAVASGTAALHLALLAVGVSHGDVVVTVSHSFIATANAIRACGAEPIFVDIEPGGYNMNANLLERLLADSCRKENGRLYYRDADRLLQLAETPLKSAKAPIGRVAAILAVHQIGFPCDIARIGAIARAYDVPWIEDAACAAGTTWNGELIGAPHSDAACFSFHPRKLITTGDGGMITTRRRDIDEKVRHLRQHGMLAAKPGSPYESYACTALNYRLTDIQAAVGIEQLRRLPELVQLRRERVELYRKALAGNPMFGIIPEKPGEIVNWQSLPVGVCGPAQMLDRAIAALAAAGIAAKPGIMNAHEEPPYTGIWQLPESERRRRETLIVPLFHDLAAADIVRITDVLNAIAADA